MWGFFIEIIYFGFRVEAREKQNNQHEIGNK